MTVVTPGIATSVQEWDLFRPYLQYGGAMRSLVLVLLSLRILFGLWSGVSHAVQTRSAAPDRTALILAR